jgi:UDP-N-acetylglucosamine--N-acetylmuramyl-(pentapeptide) pyrophosphoryl-undecaprenol N-acetylglucosamine transferase
MKILLSGGGTAGHINPAIAIAQILKRAYPEAEILFIGTGKGMEATLVRTAGYQMRELEVEGLSRKLTVKNIKVAYRALVARRQAKNLLKEERPDLVIGTGGYVCFPLLSAAQRMRIPSAIHESNAYPGLTTKILSRKASAVLLNYRACANHMPKSARVALTGNPVRSDFVSCDRKQARARLSLKDNDILLLSFGGSLGAEALNTVMLHSIPLLLQNHENLHICHVTGRQSYDSFLKNTELYFKADMNRVRIFPFIENMANYMTAADLLFSRSGAMTLTEASYTATPAILVPFPGATDDHQTKNAKMLVKENAAILIPESELNTKRLVNEISKLLTSKQSLSKMRAAIGSLAVRDANERILQTLSPFLLNSTL